MLRTVKKAEKDLSAIVDRLVATRMSCLAHYRTNSENWQDSESGQNFDSMMTAVATLERTLGLVLKEDFDAVLNHSEVI